MAKRQIPHPAVISFTPVMDAYARRIGAQRKNFRTYTVEEEEKSSDGTAGYARALATIKLRLSKDRVTTELVFRGNTALKPTAAERAAIVAEFSDAAIAGRIPSSILTALSSADDQRRKLGIKDNMWVPFFSAHPYKKSRNGKWLVRDMVTMFEERRVRPDGSKSFVPWSRFNDGQWYPMEPDGPLPLCWPEKFNNHQTMIHEGPATAQFLEYNLRSDSDSARAWRAEFPWAEELSHFQHIGMAGGALAGPGRTDWRSLRDFKPSLVVYVCDNDIPGKNALLKVSKIYNGDLYGIIFDDRWPQSYDLKDPFPKKFFDREKPGEREVVSQINYKVPRLDDMLYPATWADTELEIPNGKQVTTINDNFAEQWVYTKQVPALYINRKFPHLRYKDIDIASCKFSFKPVSAGLHRKAEAVDCLSYWPGRPTGLTVEKNRITFNDHVPSDIRPEKGSDADQNFIKKFYEYLYPNESERTEVIRWDATLVCRPEIFMGWGRLCISDTQGVGKTTHASILAELVGYHNVSFPSEAQVIGRFNAWLAHKRLVIVNEIYAGDSPYAYLKIKSLVTDRDIDVEEKFLPQYRVTNWAHFFLNSNSVNALRLEEEDRRFHIPEITNDAHGSEYWKEFYAWRSTNGLANWRWFLEDFLSRNDAVSENSNAPKSERKLRLLEAQYSEPKLFVADALTALRDEHSKKNVFMTEPAIRKILQAKFGGTDLQKYIPSPQAILSLAKVRGWYVSKGRPYVKEEGAKGRLISTLLAIKDVSHVADLDDLRATSELTYLDPRTGKLEEEEIV